MQVLEVPLPSLGRGMVQVRNHFSLISAGTEGSTVKTARTGLVGKIRERPQQVRQVLDTLRTQGVTQTYRAVMKKLDAYSPLGYSSVGEVIAVGREVTGFAVGDLVACGGLSAAHAEIVCVPEKLCVRLRDKADLRQAAYNTLGAIAMQGVRQADLRLGESCAVIGLGLLGQLTAQILKAGGIRVVGVDVDDAMVKIAGEHCAELALNRKDLGAAAMITRFTDGMGCDAVIITAATDSLDPINFAGEIARKKGTVVVVGAVPTGFDRDPHYYRKELQVRMSCSYGPGRYDPGYEDKGLDYPPAYVRWTQNRNMQAFQELLVSGKIDVSHLTTHVFQLRDAPKAYDLLLNRTEPFLGLLIEYDISKNLSSMPLKVARDSVGSMSPPTEVKIGFIGAGSYAQSHLLPNIPQSTKVVLQGVATGTGVGSRSVADRFGFSYCSGDFRQIMADEEINTVFVATRHANHGAMVMSALQTGKHVFVEKPLCIHVDELKAISDLRNELILGEKFLPIVMVGYNRRFSPLVSHIKDELGDGPMAITYRVNAGAIPADSWIQDPEAGGGRIIGEVCHFIDLLIFLNGSLPTMVHAAAMRAPGSLQDTVQVNLSFENGSIGSISYFANGDKSFPKERVEIFANGCTVLLDDFRSVVIHGHGRKKEKKLLAQDKGQRQEVAAFINAARTGGPALIPFEEMYATSLTTFNILDALRGGKAMPICY